MFDGSSAVTAPAPEITALPRPSGLRLCSGAAGGGPQTKGPPRPPPVPPPKPAHGRPRGGGWRPRRRTYEPLASADRGLGRSPSPSPSLSSRPRPRPTGPSQSPIAATPDRPRAALGPGAVCRRLPCCRPPCAPRAHDRRRDRGSTLTLPLRPPRGAGALDAGPDS